MRKSLYVRNNGDRTVTIDTAETEALSLTDAGVLRYYLESDYAGDNSDNYPDTAANIMLALAYVGIHTTLNRVFRRMKYGCLMAG